MIEKISRTILYLLVVTPMLVAAFTIGIAFGLPFACVLLLGAFGRTKYDQ